jgi:hypothetical protein
MNIMAKINWKAIGLLTTVFGAIVSIATGIVEDKKMEETIDKKLDERGVPRPSSEELA